MIWWYDMNISYLIEPRRMTSNMMTPSNGNIFRVTVLCTILFQITKGRESIVLCKIVILRAYFNKTPKTFSALPDIYRQTFIFVKYSNSQINRCGDKAFWDIDFRVRGQNGIYRNTKVCIMELKLMFHNLEKELANSQIIQQNVGARQMLKKFSSVKRLSNTWCMNAKTGVKH